jgi:pyruvate ferredoxin oxidoreductase gamma subunit|tara:strand:+ start:4428 stop:4967 length:540 start_codon:yes stop_codon:yes gene_type:complete
MLEMLILGRGGQGAQTAGKLLAEAFFAEGHQVQTFATYGGARRGTPVSASLRVDDRPIRLRCNIERASAMLCFDSSLLDANFLAAADSETRIVVNSAQSEEAFAGLGDYRIVPVDGAAIARRNNMGKVVNSALLGAFAAVLEQPEIDTMCQIVESSAPVKHQENVAACREAYQHLKKLA